jgi:hypothetical protein
MDKISSNNYSENKVTVINNINSRIKWHTEEVQHPKIRPETDFLNHPRKVLLFGVAKLVVFVCLLIVPIVDNFLLLLLGKPIKSRSRGSFF